MHAFITGLLIRPQTRFFPCLRTIFIQSLHKILSANPHFFGFAAHAQGEGLHLGWQWFESDRAPNSEILEFEAEFAQVYCWVNVSPNPQFTEFEVGFEDLFKKQARCPRQMCKVREVTCGKVKKLENAVRATNQSFKLGKSWVLSPICSNLFVVWTQPGTRKLSGLRLDLWVALLFSPSNMKIEADAAPPFLEIKQKMSVSRFKEFPGWRGNNVFCALWKN